MINIVKKVYKKIHIIQNITYYDDIGRPLQQINIDHSPGFSDIITPMQYDGYGRMEKEWLPYPATDGALATLRSGTITAIEGFYNTPKYENTANPYSQKEFEDSPLNRVYKQAAPGNDWALGQGHEIEFGYETNISSDLGEINHHERHQGHGDPQDDQIFGHALFSSISQDNTIGSALGNVC